VRAARRRPIAAIALVAVLPVGLLGVPAVRADPAEQDEPDLVAVPAFTPGHVTTRLAAELGDTTSLALDAYYDVNERFRLGATMSNAARGQLGAGRGVCVAHCPDRFAGIAADALVRLGPSVMGRAAIDAARFAPTALAAELGVDVHYVAGAALAIVVSPTLRIGTTRRDLANRDVGSLPAELDLRISPHVGVTGIARVALDLADLHHAPLFGSAGGVFLLLGPITLTARSGSTDVFHPGATLFAEVAIAWSS